MEPIEDRHPLSPMQQGMLYQGFAAPDSGINIEQLVCTLVEPLDTVLFKRAWEEVIQRHEVLRSAFRWEGGIAPRQEIRRSVECPWMELDLRDRQSGDQRRAREEYLEEDRRRGFKPDQAPLLRLALLRLGDAHYELVWTFHHALLDGRSIPLVLQEVFQCHEAFQRGGEPVRAARRPFRDYIDWLSQQDFSGMEPFWRRQLKGFTAPTPLGVDGLKGARSGVPAGARGGEEWLRLSVATSDALDSLARENGLTLNTLVQGAWAALLHRYSGMTDVVFGVTRACRRSSIPGADSMVGLFINTVPMRVLVEPQARLLDWLKRVRAGWTALREREHTPLTRIHKWSGFPHDAPLFDSLVVFEREELDSRLRGLGGMWNRRSFELRERPGFPLTLAAYGGTGLSLRILFERARFEPETIQRMLGHLQTLLSGMAEDPDRRVGNLPLLTDAEEAALLGDGSPARRFAAERTLVDWFEERVTERPDAVAVVCEGEQLTYGMLNARANQLAHCLQNRGVGPGKLVGLLVERSPDLVTGILGVLKAGGAYVPMDASHPDKRLEFIVRDARLPLVVTQRDLLGRIPRSGVDAVCLDDREALEAHPVTDAGARVTPGNPAYVIYTSGSTGQPKGVLVSHYNVVRLFQAAESAFGFNEADVWTLFHSPAFDFSVWEIWGALLYGGRLVVVPDEIRRSPGGMLDLIGRERVTVLNQTPSAFRQLIQADAEAGPNRHAALRHVILGGEALEPAILKPWFDRHGDQRPRLANMYGITETTVHVTLRWLNRRDVDAGSVIGTPLPDLRVYILDADRRPVPVGVAGEMYVAGAGLACGYLERPELASERFVANPFSPGTLFYRTGDRGRFLPDLDIEYLGRVDEQVKIRGFRVEPGEIESVLCRHEAVREAVVVAREDDTSGRCLAAYVVPADRPPAIQELREHLRGLLPDYMIPAAFVLIEKLPLTGNGKVDRQALPLPEPARPELSTPYVAPHSATEQALAEVWREVLGIKRVGVNDSFFDLGGNSLLMVQLLGGVRAALNRDLQITDLFKCPTIRALAMELDRKRAVSKSSLILHRARLQTEALARWKAVTGEVAG